MRNIVRLSVFGLFLSALQTASLAQEAAPAASQMRQHKLRVAQGPGPNFTNSDVDAILRKITGFMHSADFNGDVPCEKVEFVRDGNVITHSDLPVSGPFDDQVQAMRLLAPDANVLISFMIDCDGVEAAGCAPVNAPAGGDEMVVNSDSSTRGAVVWLHERGHIVGKGHLGQGQSANAVPEAVGRAVMFWNPSPQSTGVDQVHCTAYRHKILPTIVNVQAGSVQPAPVAEAAPLTHGLTDAAFEILNSAWVEGMPIDGVKALNDADLDSIRQMLRGNTNDLWPHAIMVLAYRGNADDLALISRALEIPAAAPSGDPTAEDRARERTRQRTILQVPSAIGLLALRTKSANAASTLRSLSHTAVSGRIAGPALSTPLSKQALRGLAVAGADSGAAPLNAATRQGMATFRLDNLAPDAPNASQGGDLVLPTPLAADIPALSPAETAEYSRIWGLARQGQVDQIVGRTARQ